MSAREHADDEVGAPATEGADAERTPAAGASSGSAARRPGDGARGVDREGGSPDAESEAIERDLAELAAERDELRQLAQRVQADFENFRKRMLREQTEKIERANEALIEQLLPVLDNFELALESLGDADDSVRKGMELVHAGLLDVLAKYGLDRIDALDKPFDPNEHEAVAQDDGEGEPVVCDVYRTGYRLKGRVIRPVTVKVTRAHA
jgi:molecular chaperone GrpE